MNAATLLDEAVALVPAAGRRSLLALAGPPAAGKSTLAQRLVDGLNDRLGPSTAAYLPLDGFHLSNCQLERLGFTDRKGAHFSFDVHGYVALLRRALSETDHPVFVPDYDRVLHEPIAARHVVEPPVRLIVTEGNYLAGSGPGWREVADLAAAVWYIDAPAPVRDARLQERHIRGGMAEQQARDWVAHNDDPNAGLVEADRRRCDKVVTAEQTHW